MENWVVGLLGLILLFVLLAIGVPVAFTLALSGFLGIAVIYGSFDQAMKAAAAVPWSTLFSFVFAVLPLFIIMGYFAEQAGIGETVFMAANKWLGGITGGLPIATVVANAAFGAACGSSYAACSVFARVTYPEMKKRGVDPSFAAATVCAAGPLAMLIPPSGLFIYYGILTQVSIGALLMAGLLPGIIMTIALSLGIYIWMRMRPQLSPKISEGRVSWKERWLSVLANWPLFVLAVWVIGGIYSGIFSPTEAGATGAFGAFVIGIIKRRLTWRGTKEAVMQTAQTTAMLFLIIIGAMIFARLLSLSGLTNMFMNQMQSLDVPPIVVVLGFVFILLLLGCFLDSVSVLAILAPLMHATAVGLGLNPIWFAVVVALSIEIGLMTPPLGMNVYVVKGVLGENVSLGRIFIYCTPYEIVYLMVLGLIIAVPSTALFIPNMMFSK